MDALFILNSEENIIKNDKFLVFDDIERCQVPIKEFVKNHVVQIRKVFDMTGCENLRILRQSLWDFNQVEIHLKPEDER